MRPKLIGWVKALTRRKPVFYLCLGALFTLSFALPMVFALKMGGLMYAAQHYDGEDPETTLFPDATKIGGNNHYLSIPDSELLDPAEGKDFLLVLWVRLRKLPSEGERMLLLSKFDGESKSRRGYALALSREGEIIRPEVYWRDKKGDGTWFTFSDLPLSTKTWTMFAITFRQKRYLGLHSASIVQHIKPSLKLLGGYEIDRGVVPSSDSPLQIGAFNRGKFRGHVGVVGVLNKPDLSRDLEEILKNLTAVPTVWPPQFDESEVALWTVDGKSDKSMHHQVELIKEGAEEQE
ncbi:MAG: hypothetical protein J5J00_04055 [Deltaproteobacteria bacterium]|nr:hypothetical protein [Deltaproteobacteria bacterium]